MYMKLDITCESRKIDMKHHNGVKQHLNINKYVHVITYVNISLLILNIRRYFHYLQ